MHACLCKAFRIFDVSGQSWSNNSELATHTERLARACGVDHVGLQAQFQQLEDMARREAATSRCDNKEAWRRVLVRLVGSRKATRELYPHDCLRPVVERWFAFCASTSGVEQSFTKGQHAFGFKQLGALPQHEWSTLKLKVDSSNNDPDKLTTLAQRVWTRCFGIPRASGTDRRKARVDTGLTRKRTAAALDKSEASFVRARRQAGAPASSYGELQQRVDALEVPRPQRAWTTNKYSRLGACSRF